MLTCLCVELEQFVGDYLKRVNDEVDRYNSSLTSSSDTAASSEQLMFYDD